MADEYAPLEGDASYSPGETQGGPEFLSESFPSGDTGEALSDSLSASQGDLRARLVEASRDPLRILGPDLFAEAVAGLFKRRVIRDEAHSKGSLFIELEGRMFFLFRDERSRARYIFQCLMGLTWPSTVSFLERRELYRRFDEGWASGDLQFLSGVPMEDVELYREALMVPMHGTCKGEVVRVASAK